MSTSPWIASLSVAAFASVTCAQQAQLHSLGVIHPSDVASYAYGLSSDGTFIVGGSVKTTKKVPLVMQACRWTFPHGGKVSAPMPLPDAPEYIGFGTLAVAVSDDGERIVGSQGLVLEYFYGLQYTGWQGMYWWDISSERPDVNWLNDVMEFTDIAADGSAACGTTRFPFFEPIPGDPIRWAGPGSKIQNLGTLGGNGQAHAISADGSIVVGESIGPAAVNTFVWTEETGMLQLPNTPADTFHTGLGMNPDGRFVVGGVVADASFWSETGGIVNIGRAAESTWAFALDVSEDGSRVVGHSVTDGDTRVMEAFLWDSKHGMRSIADILAIDYGVDTDGWRFHSATAISNDGSTIVGYGESPSRRIEAWVVRLGDAGACAADFNTDAVVNSQDFFDFLTAFFNADARADFNDDKVVNSQDFFDFLTAFFSGC